MMVETGKRGTHPPHFLAAALPHPRAALPHPRAALAAPQIRNCSARGRRHQAGELLLG
jgi:hypothetical protein